MRDLRWQVKDHAKRLARRAFEYGQRAGIDVLPRHFYSSIPDIAALRNSDDWRQPLSLTGVKGTDLARQCAFVSSCCPEEVVSRLAGRDIHLEGCLANGAEGYGPIEAAFLYCFVASRRPPRVIQIGAGVSTAIILTAARDVGHAIEVTCVDPYPTEYLRDEARLGRIELIDQPVQLVDPDLLAAVGEGGLLFIDATHTVKVGSDVNRVVFEILPRIFVPSIVHFHDITLPYDFSPTVLDSDLFFWTETVLLTAFLINNSAFSLGASLSMLHEADPATLQRLFPWYSPLPQRNGVAIGPGHYPSSAYLEANIPAEESAS